MAEKVDDTDRKLLMLIVNHPRISFRELSERLGITKQAAHHRMQALKESGVIGTMTVDISVPYLRAVPVMVSGISKAPSVHRIFDRLGECEFTRRVIAGFGNYLYVNGILREMSELDGFVDFVKRTARLRSVTIGIYSPDPVLMPHYIVDGITIRRPDYPELSRLDLRIIRSLKEDVRKPAEEIADELHVSPKTIKRHLESMTREGSIEFHVRTDSAVGGDNMFVVQMTLRDGADRAEVGRRLMSRYPFKDAFFVEYSNIPSELSWIFWTGKISDVRKVMSAVDEDADIVSLMSNIGYMMRIYSTWQDRLPEQMLRALEGNESKAPRIESGKRRASP